MNIKDAKQEIINTIKAYTAKNKWGGYSIPVLRQRPLLLIGPPGIGKTAVMAQAASECGVSFVAYTMTHHTRQSAMGLPYIQHRDFHGQDYAVTEYTMSEIIASVYRAIEETGFQEGLLFLDEINCVSETLAPAMLQFLQTKTFGSHRLPDGWVLAAAGNPAEYNKSVRDFDIATIDRLKYIPVEADYDAWRPYALASGIHGGILSYLDLHPDQFYILRNSYTHQAFVTARGWEDLSFILLEYEELSLPVTTTLIEQYLRVEDLAKEFSGYYHWYESRKKNLPVRELLSGDPDALHTCHEIMNTSSFDEKLQFVHLLLSGIHTDLNSFVEQEKQYHLYCEFCERLTRFQKIHKLPDTVETIESFLKEEHQTLSVRKEHGLSSESEIRDMEQMLYQMQMQMYQHRSSSISSLSYYSEAQNMLSGALSKQAEMVITHTENSIQMLSVEDSAAFTLFLSAIYQNPTMKLFLRKHPSALCEQYRNHLDFQSREEALRAKL